MKHLEAYNDQLKNINHPAAKITQFLLEHSNNPQYLVANLEIILLTIKCDLTTEQQFPTNMTQQNI